MWSQEEMDKALQEITYKATTDEAFRKKLLADPKGVIQEVSGLDIPEDYKIRLIDYDPAYQATFFVPPMVAEEFTPEEMDAVAGGSCAANACGANGCAGQATK
ncbi:MAG: NHLP leader peptide family natural product precursor [Eubacterium sp.]|nr:NHLP leader peptide family natural product precursor [Eubacterium sp.]